MAFNHIATMSGELYRSVGDAKNVVEIPSRHAEKLQQVATAEKR